MIPYNCKRIIINTRVFVLEEEVSGKIKPHSFHDLHNNVLKDIKRLIMLTTVIAIVAGISLALVDAKAQSAAPFRTNNAIIIHFHPRLNVTIEGKAVTVPAQIGINSSLWKDHSLDKYGMQSTNTLMPGMAPLHTMDSSGNITVESSVKRNYTLGEFFKIWGKEFDDKKVEITLDGKPVSDFKNYILNEKDNDHLTVNVDGKFIFIPPGIGIWPQLWKDHSLDKYGMKPMNMTMGGMAPLHTHDSSGTIHVESSANRNYTLGEFLNIWGLDLNGKTVKLTVDGKPVYDFRNHILRDKEHLILEIENKII
jgi:hypothetical protein